MPFAVGPWSWSSPHGGHAKDSNFGHTSRVPRADSFGPCLPSANGTLKTSLRVVPTGSADRSYLEKPIPREFAHA